jgi:hypothetical protein
MRFILCAPRVCEILLPLRSLCLCRRIRVRGLCAWRDDVDASIAVACERRRRVHRRDASAVVGKCDVPRREQTRHDDHERRDAQQEPPAPTIHEARRLCLQIACDDRDVGDPAKHFEHGNAGRNEEVGRLDEEHVSHFHQTDDAERDACNPRYESACDGTVCSGDGGCEEEGERDDDERLRDQLHDKHDDPPLRHVVEDVAHAALVLHRRNDRLHRLRHHVTGLIDDDGVDPLRADPDDDDEPSQQLEQEQVLRAEDVRRNRRRHRFRFAEESR